ncbi:OmpH family outer membrane protein [Botrimarina sp.]|uniref:OmpH family outer membrane protein n=1 Tax=Botrimarina sp. TaxID=2795802 RepID=UPI0032EF99F3
MKTQVSAALAALVAAVVCPPASAQTQGASGAAANPAANAQKFGVAVVDINFIFKNHPKFTSSMEEMKTEFQRIEGDVKGKQQQLMQMQEQKNTLSPGTPDYKRLDDQIVQMNANLQVEVTQKRKELVEKEAKIYYETYLEVQRVIEWYAQKQGLGVVLRFNGEETDPANRESIIRNINKAVQYQNQVDITGDIHTLLQRMAANSGSATK